MIESLKNRWQRDEVTLGAWCMIPSSLTAEILAKGGFDWVLVDMQHGCMDYQTAVEMIRAIDLAGSIPIVRVPWNEPGIIGRMLDAGAMGIVAPMIQSVEEATRLVEACRYPPLGRRSLGPVRVGARDGLGYVASANDRVCVIPMIETVEALALVEEIAAVPGVDALFVGPFDLSFSLGLPPGDNDGKPAFDDAIARVNGAARSRSAIAQHRDSRPVDRQARADARTAGLSNDFCADRQSSARRRGARQSVIGASRDRARREECLMPPPVAGSSPTSSTCTGPARRCLC